MFVKYNIVKLLIVTETVWNKSNDWILYILNNYELTIISCST